MTTFFFFVFVFFFNFAVSIFVGFCILCEVFS